MKNAFSFSIRHLLLWTALVALFCLALKNASAAWASAMLAVALVALAAAVLMVIFRGGAVRAYWIGFALCGWLYLGVLMYGWSFRQSPQHNPLRQDEIPTSKLSGWIYQKTYPWIKAEVEQPAATPATPYGFVYGPAPPGPYQHDFVNVAHALWTLLLAACGGALARWLYLTGPDTHARSDEEAPRAATNQPPASVQR